MTSREQLRRIPRNRSKLPLGIRFTKFAIKAIAWPIRTIYTFFFAGLDRRSALRQAERFRAEVEETMATLLLQHSGAVAVEWWSSIPAPFGYLTVVATFPDRRLSFLRGRSEYEVRINTGGDYQTIFSAALPSANGDRGRDGGTLIRSSLILEKHWDELPDASHEQALEWDMSSRRGLWGL